MDMLKTEMNHLNFSFMISEFTSKIYIEID